MNTCTGCWCCYYLSRQCYRWMAQKGPGKMILGRVTKKHQTLPKCFSIKLFNYHQTIKGVTRPTKALSCHSQICGQIFKHKKTQLWMKCFWSVFFNIYQFEYDHLGNKVKNSLLSFQRMSPSKCLLGYIMKRVAFKLFKTIIYYDPKTTVEMSTLLQKLQHVHGNSKWFERIFQESFQRIFWVKMLSQGRACHFFLPITKYCYEVTFHCKVFQFKVRFEGQD